MPQEVSEEEMKTKIKRLKLKKLSNTRDMGGLNAVEGHIKSGKLIRSGKLYKLPKSTVKKLESFHIQTVIDLRTEQEAAEKPDTVIPGANHVQLSLLNVATFGVTFEKDLKQTLKSHGDEILEQFGTFDDYMTKIYDDILFSETSQENLRAALKIIIEAEGCVLFHCTGGKDRTGVLAMLVESLLGVDEETIMLDYAATGEFQKGRNRTFRLLSVFMPLNRKIKKTLIEFLKTKPQHMERVIAKIKAQYGSVIGYCKTALGITEEEILTMRKKYLV